MARVLVTIAGIALFVGAGTALTATSAVAALPPYWQSAREIATILNDPQVHDAFPRELPINSIVLTAPDVYAVKSGDCIVTVNIVDKPVTEAEPMMAGPRQFDLEVGAAVCRPAAQ